MAQITLTIPDSMFGRVADGLALAGGWTPGDGPKADFAKTVLVRFMIQTVRNVEEAAAVTIADANARRSITDVEGLS